MKSDSFVFYRSFYEAVKKIPKGEREELYEAIFEYALNGECYAGDNGVAGMVLEFVRPQIDANIKRRKNGMKGAEAGKKGGRPKKPQENPTQTPRKPQENPTQTPNVNVNVECLNDNDNSFFLEKEKIILDFSLLLLSEGRANATKEARAAYECNEAEGWQCEVHRRDGSVVVKDFSKNKLSRLKGWRRSVQPTIPIADAMLWVKVLKAIKDTAVKNEALIDDFTGFDVQEEGTVLRLDFATQSAWRTLAAELKENKGLRDGIYEVLRTKYPALKQAFFYSKSPY